MAIEFQKGDVVQLKSGGPRMTIYAVEDDEIFCIWFDKTKRFDGSFDAAVLDKPGPRQPVRNEAF